jgi:predicted RNA-binding protein
MTNKTFIVVASLDHVQRGVKEGIIQACHGKCAPLKRMKKGDKVICYSPKRVFEQGASKSNSYQRFSAIGTIQDDEVYQIEMASDFKPHRRRVEFHDCVPVDVKPILNNLSFIKNKEKWGMAFRSGMIEISEKDYQVIASLMTNKE